MWGQVAVEMDGPSHFSANKVDGNQRQYVPWPCYDVALACMLQADTTARQCLLHPSHASLAVLPSLHQSVGGHVMLHPQKVVGKLRLCCVVSEVVSCRLQVMQQA